ncbi:formimidoylglutamate deiminase [Temperatibacter marinus]|uniref:Formimidoylglutamate deiminase n=1 Tax=Temperatibacter marinus TaxID=1456591 RepID=A0AA52EGS0_9PROT|nr:formimidoylglutamate deiminase [Temperatibacter marinus]WND01781.1 formimidoylglutamate deiminase [Temperatibacter marinus]
MLNVHKNQIVQIIYCKSAHVEGKFRENVQITIDDLGVISSIEWHKDFPEDVQIFGHALPGMANVHSHAFQRAMAGLAEYRVPGKNSFWSWREAMYSLADCMSPDLLYAIARQLYVELLKAGYTSIGEFHYVHNSHEGEAAQMAQSVIGAAQSVGLPMTFLPVLYQTSDFGAMGAEMQQQPFLHRIPAFFRLLDEIRPSLGKDDNLGIAIHSLRAVPEAPLKEAIARFSSGPIHIHIAEQRKEVEDCIAFTTKRPVEWLLDTFSIDERWTLIHATHLTKIECERLAFTGAVAGLCPATEANLGDGFFPSKEYMDYGGAWAIGSDSHISTDLREELKQLEYNERLLKQERCVLAKEDGHVGEFLYHNAALGGAQSLDQPIGELKVGKRADLVILDLTAPQLINASYGQILDSFIFTGQACPIDRVMVAGQWRIVDGQHPIEEEVLNEYREAIKALNERDV